VGDQDSLNVQLPTGNTVVGDVVSVDSGTGIAVLSIPSDTPSTPIAPSTASPTNTGAVVMTPGPTPVTIVQDASGTQITTSPDAHVGEGALVLDSAKRLIGLCTLGDDGVHVVGAQDILAAINGAIANQPTPTLGLELNPDDLTVTALTPGGPAETATIQVGDIISAVDGTPVTTRDEIKAIVQSHHPGETATVTVIKAGATEPTDVPVVLAANPGI
jgi:S1-C subfamily serine protease